MPKRGGTVEINADRWLAKPTGPYLLTLKKAAEVLGLTTWAMRERVWKGAIPVVKFDGGRKLYIDTRDLEDFIERHKKIWK